MKRIMNLRVSGNQKTGGNYAHMVLSPVGNDVLPEIQPGQFVNIEVAGSKTTFLRRPISVCDVSDDKRELHLMIRIAGEGTKTLSELEEGSMLNVLLPLGNTFPLVHMSGKKVLLIGGGIGAAPLYYYMRTLKAYGVEPSVLLGARSENDLLLSTRFGQYGNVYITTDDGSAGKHGLVTEHEILDKEKFDLWVCCGPSPMMKAVAKKAKEKKTLCYVSLENMMACGLGACLCCVEKTVKGNVCVCTEGPVFNTESLTWF